MGSIFIIKPSISNQIKRGIKKEKTKQKNNNKLTLEQKKINKKQYDHDYHIKNRDKILEYQRHRYYLKKLNTDIVII